MDEFKIIDLMVQYFGESGSIAIAIIGMLYAGFKFYLTSKQSDVIRRIEEYLKTLSQKYSDTITFEQAEVVLKSIYCDSACALIKEVHDIIERNNIDKEWKSVLAKLKDIIDIRYAEDYSRLTKFVFNGIPLASVMENIRRDYYHDGIVGILEKFQKQDAMKQSYSFIKNSSMRYFSEDLAKIDKRRRKND